MKHIYLLLVAISFGINTNAQPTGWEWAHTAGSGSTANGIARDGNGNVYVVGNFNYPSITLGGHTVLGEGSTDVYIAKYNDKGEVQWLRRAGERETDEGQAIATDAEGNVYITGTFAGSVMNFDSISIQGVGSTTFYVAKYNTEGYIQWVRTASSGGKFSRGGSIAVDADGSAYIAGTYRGPQFVIGDTKLEYVKYYYGIFLIKYDSDGNQEWTEWADGPGIDEPLSIAVKGNDLYMVGGFTSGGISFPGGSILPNLFSGKYSVFLTRYNAQTGNLVWSRNSRGLGKASGVCIGNAGELYVSGLMLGDTLRIGSTTLTGGPGNAFIAQYDAQGAGKWARQSTGGGISNGPAITTDRNGHVFIAGAYGSSPISFDTVTLNQTLSGRNTDMYITAYDTTGGVRWGLSVGGEADETLNSIAAGVSGEAFVAGSAASPSFFVGIKEFNCDTTEAFIAKIGKPTIGIGIQETTTPFPVSVYPNPSTGSFMVNIPNTATRVEILNAMGQVIQEQTVSRQYNLPLSIKASGIYFIRVSDGKNSTVQKVVVL